MFTTRTLNEFDIVELSKTQGVIDVIASDEVDGIYQITTADGFPKTFDFIQFYWVQLGDYFVLKLKDWQENKTNLNVGDVVKIIQ